MDAGAGVEVCEGAGDVCCEGEAETPGERFGFVVDEYTEVAFECVSSLVG